MGRVQRRTPSEPLDLRPFHDDVAALVERGRFSVRAAGQYWVASDLAFDATETFAVGLMRIASRDLINTPDDHDFS